MKNIKCVVWDLDNTIWDGVLSEDKEVLLKSTISNVINTLDGRGILLSIASKNNFYDAMGKLKEFKLNEYFLYPQIGWQPKSEMINQIKEKLNIGFDTIMFIDDENFELEEVRFTHPSVECVNSKAINGILNHSRLKIETITADSARRRLMYQEDSKRTEFENSYTGTKQEFLEYLNMKFIISNAQIDDLVRAEELTTRTNQLNSTGITYGYEDLKTYINSPDYQLLICELNDKFGSYGKIGLVLIEQNENIWHIRLLLMSCRVMSRGLGSVLLNYVMNQAKMNHKILHADFKDTGKNKIMYLAYKFANFQEMKTNDEIILLENRLESIQPIPVYLELIIN